MTLMTEITSIIERKQNREGVGVLGLGHPQLSLNQGISFQKNSHGRPLIDSNRPSPPRLKAVLSPVCKQPLFVCNLDVKFFDLFNERCKGLTRDLKVFFTFFFRPSKGISYGGRV